MNFIIKMPQSTLQKHKNIDHSSKMLVLELPTQVRSELIRTQSKTHKNTSSSCAKTLNAAN
jgi:hypothetical protein